MKHQDGWKSKSRFDGRRRGKQHRPSHLSTLLCIPSTVHEYPLRWPIRWYYWLFLCWRRSAPILPIQIVNGSRSITSQFPWSFPVWSLPAVRVLHPVWTTPKALVGLAYQSQVLVKLSTDRSGMDCWRRCYIADWRMDCRYCCCLWWRW